jgi:hypothetical protein
VLVPDPRGLAGEVEEERLRIGDGEVAQVAAHAGHAVAAIREEAVLADRPQVARLQVGRDPGDGLGREQREERLRGIGEADLQEVFLARHPDRAAGVVEGEVLEALRVGQCDAARQRARRVVLLQRRLGEDPEAAVLRHREIARADGKLVPHDARGIEMEDAILESGPDAAVVRVERELLRRAEARAEVADRNLEQNGALLAEAGDALLRDRPE